MVKGRHHWKEHWDPDAQLIFLKKLRLKSGKDPNVYPGDPVTKAMRAKLGLHKLRIWWRGQFVGRPEFHPELVEQAACRSAASSQRAKRKRTRSGIASVIKLGRSGWYRITMRSGEVRKVRGKAAADELLAAQGA